MYKITIDLSDWGTDDEILTVETFDFDKINIIREFIEFQKDHGWAVDYDVVTDEEDFEDEDGDFFYDEESNAWYQYNEENDEWIELDGVPEEDEEDEEIEVAGDTYIFNITTADKE
jgi:hypothetical protein